MFNLLPISLSPELETFLSFLKIGSAHKFSNSPFVQEPDKICYKVFKHFSQKLIAELYSLNEAGIKTWKGFRLLSINVSSITLPITKELKAKYGETKNNTTTSIIQARCSVLYDVENKYVVDGELVPIVQDERSLAFSHLTHCKQGDVILCDRSYPAYDFIKYHVRRNLDYVIRVKFGFSKQIHDFKNSKKQSQIVAITPDGQEKKSVEASNKSTQIKVRLIKVELSKGHVDVLMTSLLDKKNYPNSIFQSLYDKRQSSEISYDEVENKLKVDYLSA
jgi:hypothetical protein